MRLATADWAEMAWAQLWQVSLLIAVVALVQWAFCRRRPHLAHALWMVVMLKCLTPPVVSSPTGVFSWLVRSLARPAVAAMVTPGVELPADVASPVDEPPIDLPEAELPAGNPPPAEPEAAEATTIEPPADEMPPEEMPAEASPLKLCLPRIWPLKKGRSRCPLPQSQKSRRRSHGTRNRCAGTCRRRAGRGTNVLRPRVARAGLRRWLCVGRGGRAC